MARINTKRKHYPIKLTQISLTVFIVSALLFLFSSIIIRTYNVQLSVKIQKMQQEITLLNRNNHILSIELQALMSKERVMAIALEAGLSSNQDNIIIISEGE